MTSTAPNSDGYNRYVAFKEQAHIVKLLDQVARAEGLKRTDIIRRAVRVYLQQIPIGVGRQDGHASQNEPITLP